MNITFYVPEAEAEDLEKFRVILKLFNVSLSKWVMGEVKKRLALAGSASTLLRALNEGPFIPRISPAGKAKQAG